MNYDGTGQAVVAVIDTENSKGTPFGVTGAGDYAVRNLTNTMYVVASMSGIDGFGNATVYTNHILEREPDDGLDRNAAAWCRGCAQRHRGGGL